MSNRKAKQGARRSIYRRHKYFKSEKFGDEDLLYFGIESPYGELHYCCFLDRFFYGVGGKKEEFWVVDIVDPLIVDEFPIVFFNISRSTDKTLHAIYGVWDDNLIEELTEYYLGMSPSSGDVSDDYDPSLDLLDLYYRQN